MAASPKVRGGRNREARPTKVGQRGSVPDDIVIELPIRNHMDGCPMEEDAESLDFWTAIPRTGQMAGEEVVFIRCVRCGGERAITLRALRDEQAESDEE